MKAPVHSDHQQKGAQQRSTATHSHMPRMDAVQRKAYDAIQQYNGQVAQRDAEGELDEEPVSPKLASGTPSPQPVQRQEASPNNTGMPGEVKSKMEGAFNTDFSDVKVHTESAQAKSIGALAYTQGSDVHFAPGQFKPETSSGQQLIGHELTHVVQQREGRVQANTEIGGMPVNNDPGLEAEADSMGSKAATFG